MRQVVIDLRFWVFSLLATPIVGMLMLAIAYDHGIAAICIERIDKGMTATEVISILGEPEDTVPLMSGHGHPAMESFVYPINDGLFSRDQRDLIVDIDMNTSTVQRKYMVNRGPDERGFVRRIWVRFVK